MLELLRDYLRNGLGGLGDCRPVGLPSSFPLIILRGYTFYRAQIVGADCMIALATSGVTHTPRMVQKQLSRVSAEYGVPVVFVTNILHVHDKERYLAAMQPIVVPGKFAYLPFVGVKQDDSRRPFVMTRETLSPIAQLIVLSFLEHKLNTPVVIKDVVEILKVSHPAVQNAFKEIEFLGLAARGRLPGMSALGLVFSASGRELWDMAQPFLVSPVKRTVGLLRAPQSDGGCVVAGVDALSEISHLNIQSPTEYAMPLNGFAKRNLEMVSTVGAPVKLQLWSYAPTCLGGASIDVLSLILSLRSVTDDRVRIEIDRLLEEFKW